MLDQPLTPISDGCNAQRGEGGPQRDDHCDSSRARATPPRAAPRGLCYPSLVGRQYMYGGRARAGRARARRRARTWRPRRVRSVKHPMRHDALSLLEGCWGQTQDVGGPTKAALRACYGCSCWKRSGINVLTWQKGAFAMVDPMHDFGSTYHM